MSYDTFKKEIKCILSSRKTLTFAWQCMTIDKKHSEQEEELFNNLCKDVGVVDSAEIEWCDPRAGRAKIYSFCVDEYIFSRGIKSVEKNP